MTRRSRLSLHRKSVRTAPASANIESAEQQKVPVGHESVTRYGYSHFIALLPLEGTGVSYSAIRKRIKRHLETATPLPVQGVESEQVDVPQFVENDIAEQAEQLQ